MYQLRLTSQAQRQLDKLHTEDPGRIVAAWQRLGGNPRPSGVKKLSGSTDRVRVGDWRIIYAIFDRDNLILVGKIARRSKDTSDRLQDLF